MRFTICSFTVFSRNANILMNRVLNDTSCPAPQITKTLEFWDSSLIQECGFVLLLSQLLVLERFSNATQYIENVRYLINRGITGQQLNRAFEQYPEFLFYLFKFKMSSYTDSDLKNKFSRIKAECLIDLLTRGVSADFSDRTRYSIVNHLIEARRDIDLCRSETKSMTDHPVPTASGERVMAWRTDNASV